MCSVSHDHWLGTEHVFGEAGAQRREQNGLLHANSASLSQVCCSAGALLAAIKRLCLVQSINLDWSKWVPPCSSIVCCTLFWASQRASPISLPKASRNELELTDAWLQAGHPEADQQHSHPVIDRVGSRRLASMRSVQGASMLPARSLHMPDLDEELPASALSRQQRADSAAPATSYQPQSSRAYELAAVGEDTYLGRADEQDRTFGMAGLTTTQWSDDSILSQVLAASSGCCSGSAWPYMHMGEMASASQWVCTPCV